MLRGADELSVGDAARAARHDLHRSAVDPAASTISPDPGAFAGAGRGVR
jgi:hypothetical protein